MQFIGKRSLKFSGLSSIPTSLVHSLLSITSLMHRPTRTTSVGSAVPLGNLRNLVIPPSLQVLRLVRYPMCGDKLAAGSVRESVTLSHQSYWKQLVFCNRPRLIDCLALFVCHPLPLSTIANLVVVDCMRTVVG